MGSMKVWDGTTWQTVSGQGPPGVGGVTSVDGRTGAVVLTDKYVPLVPNTGWTVTAGYTADKQFNPESTTVTEIARVLGTVIDAMKATGMLGT